MGINIFRHISRPGARIFNPHLFPFTLFFLVLFIACSNSSATVKLRFKNLNGSTSPVISAELAKTEGEHRLGLMYRKQLGAEAGMLFEFPNEQPRSFWMKNTYLELDMVFLDKDMKVVSIVERAVPLTEVARESKLPAQFVLEILGGKAKEWGVGAGSVLKVQE